MQQNKLRKLAALVIASSLIGSVNAGTPPDAHVWHMVYSNSGVWHATLAPISENAAFIDQDGQPMTQFKVDPTTPVKYGFNYGSKDDFDIAYTLTMTQQAPSPKGSTFTSKTCIFIVTATSPGHPEIQVLSYNGAKCTESGYDANFYAE